MKAHTVVVIFGLLAGLAYGQAVIFSVTGSESLAEAAQQFEMRYGIPVSYEAPNYAYEGDLVDDNDAGYPGYARRFANGSKALVKGGPLALRGDPNKQLSLFNAAADAMPMLQSLVDDHAKADYPGRFTLIPTGDGVAIVPTAIKNAAGILVPDQSLLETRITLPLMRRTVDETVEAISKAIRTSTGKNIVAGDDQFRSAYYAVTVGATNEPARGVLDRTLTGFEFTGGASDIPKAAWTLKYSPGLKMYILHVRQVVAEVPTPAGGKIKRPVFR